MAGVRVFRMVRVLATLGFAAMALSAPSCAQVKVIDTAGPAPEIDGLEPAIGPSEGGTPVVIHGRQFEKGAVVRFGGRLAAKMEWVSASTINAMTPPGSGKVSVSVENPGRRTDTVDEAFTYTGATGCAVVSGTPDLGEEGVPVVGEMRLKYSAPLDVTSLEGAVTLKHLETGDEVPVAVALSADTDADVLVQPKHSLRFWGAYALVTNDKVQALDGAACAPAGLAFATVRPEPLPRALRPAQVNGLVLAGDTVLAASAGYRGLQVYNVANPEKAALASDLVTPFSPLKLVALGKRAYAPAGFAGVQIFDISDPKTPVLIGYGGTPGYAVDVAPFEKGGRTFLAVAEMSDGVRILDATETDDVNDLGTLDLGPGVKNAAVVYVESDRIAVGNGSRFVIVELPDPLSLGSQKLLASFDVTRPVTALVLEGSHLFVAKSRWGIAAYDVSKPDAPVLVDSKEDPDGTCPLACVDDAQALLRDGEDLFVAFGRGGVVRFGVGGTGALTELTHYVVPANVRQVAVTGEHVLAGGDEGLVVFDRHGDGSKPLWIDPNGHGVARTVVVKGGLAYATASLRGVQTFSLEDPEAPAMIDRDDTPASLKDDFAAFGLSLGAAESKVLAVGDGRAGLTLFDLSNPKDPVLGGSVDTSDGVGRILQVGDVTYVCNGNEGVVVVDTTSAGAPKEIGHTAFDDFPGPDGCEDLLLAEKPGLLYVGRQRGLGVLDISDPTKPQWKALVMLPSKDSIRAVRRVGTHLLAVSSGFDYEGKNYYMSRLRMFDLADPVVPKLTWSGAEDLGGSAGLTIIGDKAFVAANSSGLHVFDISNVQSPVLEGTIATPGSALHVAEGQGVIYVAEGAGGVQAIRTGPLPAPVTK
jgi:hypothetical protein